MLLSELFEDATIPQLQQSIEQGFPDTKKRQHATNEVQVAAYQYIPKTNVKLLQVVSNTNSQSGGRYNQVIVLRDVQYDMADSATNISIDRGGKKFYVKPVAFNTTNVAVSCNCPDYIMRFAHTNAENNCHVGQLPPQYIRKTTDRPSANPNHVPGMCKHLLKMTEDLQRTGLLN
ncbi:MAG: hypothetical protein CTY12_00045 [Methylotenera sp.]|nr:MAG: hypothetical protein CTY12_00045 [Methylotenera sp.]